MIALALATLLSPPRPEVPVPRLLDVLAPPDGRAGDAFGEVVAMDGPWIAVAAPGHDLDGSAGAIYLYRREHRRAGWELQAKVTPPITLGYALTLALQDGTLVVGAPYHDPGGAVFVYERDDADPSTWTLAASHFGAIQDGLGASVAIDGDAIVAGAPDLCPPTFCVPEEYAEVYDRDLGGPDAWGRRTTLPTFGSCQSFGQTVALEGDRLFVGIPAWKYLCIGPGGMVRFERDGAGWSFAGTHPPAPVIPNPSQFGSPLAHRAPLVASFGTSFTAATGTVATLEVRAEDRGGPGAWGVVSTLAFPELAEHPAYLSLAFVGDHLLVGDPDEPGSGPGRVLLVARTGVEYDWEERIPLLSPLSRPQDRFGAALASSGETFVVGSPATGEVGEVWVWTLGERGRKLGRPR